MPGKLARSSVGFALSTARCTRGSSRGRAAEDGAPLASAVTGAGQLASPERTDSSRTVQVWGRHLVARRPRGLGGSAGEPGCRPSDRGSGCRAPASSARRLWWRARLCYHLRQLDDVVRRPRGQSALWGLRRRARAAIVVVCPCLWSSCALDTGRSARTKLWRVLEGPQSWPPRAPRRSPQ